MSINETNTPKPLLNAALAYAAQGWRVVPLHSFVDGLCTCESQDCSSPAKHPLTVNGVYAATTNVDTIRRWWSEAAIANVGVATGNGVIVVDVDAKHNGLQSLADLEAKHGVLPTTPTVKSGGGGKHYYFRIPTGTVIGNRAGVAPGIDVRSDGGYVVAPPSLHASGQRYEWLVPMDTPLAELPAWLVTMLVQKPSDTTATTSTSINTTQLTVQAPTDDLRTHPGVGEGQRNAVLCRLVGVHLARGDDPDDIAPLATAWANRCTPPLEEAEVKRTLSSLAAKHRRSTIVVQTTSDGDEVDLLPLPEPPQWPVLHNDALYGLAGDLVRTLEPETEADPVGLLLSFLVCFGNAVGRSAYFPVEGDQHHANLFLVLVGESSRGRKGTSLGRTLSLFEDADAEWKKNCISNGLSSGEGLIWALRDPVEVMEPVKEKGQITGYQNVVKDKGVTDKRLLVVESEFAQTLKVMKREGNTLSPVIRQAWDSGTLTAMTKNNFAKANGAHASILGHITRQELAKSLADTDCFNGFANRFLWCLVRRSKLLPEGGNGLDLQPFRAKLSTILSSATRTTAMSRCPDARALWHALYHELTGERPGLYGAVTGRGEAQTLRLSMLYSLLDGANVINVPHLRAATAVWRYCENSARIIFEQTEADAANPVEKLLLDKIRQEPGIKRSGLYKAIGGHITARELVQHLAHLRDRGQARCETSSTGGRPSECWYPTSPPSPVGVPSPVAPTTTATLSLAELFDAVSRMGGRIVRDGDGCKIDAQADRVTPDMKAALDQHRATLLTLLPCSPPATVAPEKRSGQDVYLSQEEFMAALAAM